MLNSNLRNDTNFATFLPRKSVSIHGFWIVASSILMTFVLLLENDDVFRLSIYLDIYFFFLCWHFARPKRWGISVKEPFKKFIKPFILRCLLVTFVNKTSKILILKLTADPMQAWQQHWHYRKCLIASSRLFPTC